MQKWKSDMYQSTNVWAFSPLLHFMDGEAVTEIRLESVLLFYISHWSSAKGTKFRFQLELKCNSDLKKCWNWLRLDSDLIQTWLRPEVHTCCRVLTFTGKQLPGSRETLQWHLIPAPRSHILEKGNQTDPLFRVLQKVTLTFLGAQGPERLWKIWCILQGTPRWKKTLTHIFNSMIPRR